MMTAVVREGPGPEGIVIKQMPIPTIGDGDVLIKVKAAGLCGSEVHVYKTPNMRFMGRAGVIAGHEFMGEVVEVGKRVRHWKVGDRVASDNTGYACGECNACLSGEPILCKHRRGLGSYYDGGWAQYCKIGEEILSLFPGCLVHVPDCVSDEVAAILDPISNGYCAVVQHGSFLPGDSVAVIGVGPLGLACINAAKAAGAAHILAIVRASTNSLHRERAIKMGATAVLEQEKDDIRQIVDTLTHGEGLASVYECAGPASLYKLCVDITRNGGKIVRVGMDHSSTAFDMDVVNSLLFRNISLIGHNGYNPLCWSNSLRLLEAGRLNPQEMITHVLPLTDYRKGVDAMLNREAIKVVYKPWD